MKNQIKKNPVTITNYEKHFEDFASMIADLKSVHPEINNIFDGFDEMTPLNAIFCLIDYMNDGHIPDVLSGANLPCALSFTANRASLKTAKFISFSWNFKYTKNKELVDIVASVSIYSRENDSAELLDTIDVLSNKANGWTVMPQK